MFKNRLAKVYKHLSKQAKRMGVTCYRIYDHDLPEFPFCIEVYQDKVYVAEYHRRHRMEEDIHQNWLIKCVTVISEILQSANENIFLKTRQRKQGRKGQYQKVDSANEEFEVIENGLKFFVNLTDYLDTGLFLDHRTTRQMVREQCNEKKVLNLFAYTGSFSVYAASGNAAAVTTVDLSNTYLAWAERNMKLNGFTDETKFKWVRADVKQYLKTIPSASFDLIVMDPPTFSNSQRMEDILDIQRDHPGLINDCLRALSAEGKLYFSTNFTKFVLNKELIKSSEIKDITKVTTPFDFVGRLNRWCYLIKNN